jgi:hypothetical protein
MTSFVKYLENNELLANAFKFIIENNKGAYNPYHSTFHLLDVFTTSMEIAKVSYPTLSETDKIELGIAALFHDFDHSGGEFKDDIDNIELALLGLVKFMINNSDTAKKYNINTINIMELIQITEFPHKKEVILPTQMILRDADTIQCYNKNWFLNVITGFQQRELGLSISKGIENQIKFIENVKYCTSHAKYIHSREQEEMLKNLYFLASIYK